MLVRPFQTADGPQLLAFLRRHYPASPQKAHPQRFQRRFAEHPTGSSLDRYYLALEGDKIVGQLATLRDRVHSQGVWHEAFWLVDLMIAPEHRGGLTALRLFQSQVADGALLLATGAGPHLLPLYTALGWRRRSIAETYYLPIRPGRLLNMAASTGRVRRRPLLGPALWAADCTLPLAQQLRWLASRPPRGISIEPLGEFGPELDRLAEQLLPALGNTCWRTGLVLDWKLHRTGAAAPIAFAARGADGALRGYIVAKHLRRDTAATWVEVVDYLAPPSEPDVFVALLAAVARQALATHADFVRVRLSCAAHIARLRFPWWVRRTEPVADDVFLHCGNPGLLASLTEDPWHLTSLASDRADGGNDRPADDYGQG